MSNELIFDKSVRIYIVDDSSVSLAMVNNSLTSLGYSNITQFPSGVEALKAMEATGGSRGCDFMVLDWHMPELSGLELLQRIRGMTTYATLPVMMLTAEAEKTEIIKAVMSGVSGYVLKPYTPESFLAGIQMAYRYKLQKDNKSAA